MSIVDGKSLGHLTDAEHGLSSTSIERKLFSKEDPAATTVEFLRARLLAERSASKAAQQRARQLAKKVLELEQKLQSEVQLHGKAESTGVKVLATQNQDFSLESYNSDELDLKEDSFGKKIELLDEMDIDSMRVSVEEELLQRQNVDADCDSLSGLVRDESASSVGRTDKYQNEVGQDVVSSDYMIRHGIRDSGDTLNESTEALTEEGLDCLRQSIVPSEMHHDMLSRDQKQSVDQVPGFACKSSLTRESKGELAKNYAEGSIWNQRPNDQISAFSDGKINQVEIEEKAIKDVRKEHLEDTIFYDIQDAENQAVIPESGRHVDKTSSSILEISSQEADNYVKEMGVSNQSPSPYGSFRSKGETFEESESFEGRRKIENHTYMEAESHDKCQSGLTGQLQYSDIPVSTLCNQSKPGADDALTEERGTSSGGSARDIKGWHRVQHKRLSSSFKFNVQIDYSEEGTDFVEESNKAATVDKSESSKIEENLSRLPASTIQDADLQRKMATKSHTPSTSVPSNMPMVSPTRGIDTQRQSFSPLDQTKVVPVVSADINAQGLLVSQMDQTKVDDVPSSTDRRGKSWTINDSHQSSSCGYYGIDPQTPFVVQKQDKLGSSARRDFLLQEPEPSSREASLPSFYSNGEREGPGNLSSIRRNTFHDGRKAMLQPGRNPVDKDQDDRTLFNPPSGTSKQMIARNQNMSTSKTMGMEILQPPSQALLCRDFDGRLVESEYPKDSPWVETFRRRIRQYIDPRRLRSLGGLPEQYYSPHYNFVQRVSSPYMDNYYGRSRAEDTTQVIKRPLFSEQELLKSQISRNVLPDPHVMNASRPSHSNLDRVKGILQALQTVKLQIQSSSEDFVLQNNIGHRVRQLSGRRLPELPSYIAPTNFSDAYSHHSLHTSEAEFSASQHALSYGQSIPRPTARTMMDSRNIQHYVKGESVRR